MHILLGMLLTLAAFVFSHQAQRSLEFGGLFNPAAMILLGLGPIGVSLFSTPLAEWATSLRVLVRAFRHDRSASLIASSEEMSLVARALRESRFDEAAERVAAARSEHVRTLAAHALFRYEPDAMRDAVAASSFRWMSEVRNADEFFQGLGRLSPAFGMIGTIMGLVDLFGNMRDSASLGPGMAMALLATLYGLFLCYCVYLPLAMRIRTYLSAGIGEQRLIERSLSLIADGRPVQEVRDAFLEAALNGSGGPASAAQKMEPRT